MNNVLTNGVREGGGEGEKGRGGEYRVLKVFQHPDVAAEMA